MEAAAIAGGFSWQHGHGLAVKTEYAAVRVGNTSQHAGIVDEKFGGKIVGTVNDEIILPDDVKTVRGIKIEQPRFDLYFRVDGLQLGRR